MPITKNAIPPLNLLGYEVYIEDTTNNSDYFNVTNLPSAFTGGRNSFLLGGSYFLQEDTVIQIEIVDSEDKPIYQTVINNYVQGQSLLVSLEVYDTTANGFSTLVIMGKAKETANGRPIPKEWKDVYNVRWTKKILTDYNLRNTSPIIFTTTPELTVEENIFYNINSSSYDTLTIPFTASLQPTIFTFKQTGYGISAELPSRFDKNYKNGFITGSLQIQSSSISNIYLPINKILSSKTAFTTNNLIYSPATGEVVKTIYLKSGSYITSINGFNYPVTTSLSLQYSVINTSSINIPISYANLRLIKLNTVSGEIYKFRVYNKVATDPGDYKIVGDVYVNINEILVSSSIRGNIPIGNIYEARNYTSSWYAGTLQANSDPIKSVIYPISGTLTYYDSSVITNQLTVSSSDDILLSSIYANVPIDLSTNKFANTVSSSGYFIGTKNAYKLNSSTEYTLSFDAYYKQRSGSVNLEGTTPKVDIYLIGSGSTQVITKHPLGQKIGEINVSNKVQWFENKQINFSPAVNSSGSLGLRFIVTNGFWKFSNISITPASDPQFSPDEVSLLIQNTDYRNELLQYKVEFFDVNNNSSTLAAISTPTFFTGSTIDLGTLPPS